MGKLSRKAERQAWTDHVLGKTDAPSTSKYHNERAGKYASKHEAEVATKLAALASSGAIVNLQEQYPIVLVDGSARSMRSIVYIADFVYWDPDGRMHVLDAKGMKTQVYKLKKKLALLLHNIEIEEV
jgi:hypothetical protein